MVSNVRQGARAEMRSIAVLEADGYVCTRSAGSRGVWDLIGIRRTDVVLVQVKTRRWPKSVELRKMREFQSSGARQTQNNTDLNFKRLFPAIFPMQFFTIE